jgi:hypothetical protein
MMTILEPTITRASSADRSLVVDVITRAFAADPPSRWIYPKDSQYWRFFPRFVEAFGGSAIDYGTAEMAADGGASTRRGSKPHSCCSSRWPGTTRLARIGTCRSSASRPGTRDVVTGRC